MVLIQNTIVSLDILEKEFCCDLDRCHGACCIEGDAGAPLTDEEAEQLHTNLPRLISYMSKQALERVKEAGISYRDKDNELVTQIVNGKDCVFARTDHNGWCYCVIERAQKEGKIAYGKPVSCHLYPIRVKEFAAQGSSPAMTALEYHRWDICHCARLWGRKQHMPLYVFLKEPLIRCFGQQWYDELCLTAEEWRKQSGVGLSYS